MRNAPGAGQWSAAGVQEELGPVAAVELWSPEREIAPRCFRRRTPERDEAILAALPVHADDSTLEVHGVLLEPHGLRDAQSCSVQELDERPVAKDAGGCSRRGVDESLGLRGGERSRKTATSPRELDRRGRVLDLRADEDQVPEVRPHGGHTTGERRRREPGGAHLGEPALEVLDGRVAHVPRPERGERGQIAAVGVERARGAPGGQEQQIAIEIGVGREGRPCGAGPIRRQGPPLLYERGCERS